MKTKRPPLSTLTAGRRPPPAAPAPAAGGRRRPNLPTLALLLLLLAGASATPPGLHRRREAEEEARSVASNDRDDGDDAAGAYVAFDPLGLRLDPIIDASGGAFAGDAEAELVRYALEVHLNETFRRSAALDFSIGGHFAYARVDEVRFAEVVVVGAPAPAQAVARGGGGRDLRGGDDVGVATGTGGRYAVASVAGRAFYVHGLWGGAAMAVVPSSRELHALVAESIEIEAGGVVGGELAGRIRELSSGDEFGGGVAATLGGVETAREVELPTDRPTRRPSGRPTVRPTDRPTSRPTDRPTGRPTASPVTDAPSTRPAEVEVDAPVPAEGSAAAPTAAGPPEVSDAPSPSPSTPSPAAAPEPSSTSGPARPIPPETIPAGGGEDGGGSTAVDVIDAVDSAVDASVDTGNGKYNDEDNDEGIIAGGDADGNDTSSADDDATAGGGVDGNVDADAGEEDDSGANGSDEGGADNGGNGASRPAPIIDASKGLEDGGSDTTTYVVYAVGGICLALSVAIVLALVVRKRRRGSNNYEDGSWDTEGDNMKGVPMHKLADDGECYDDVREYGEDDPEAPPEMAPNPDRGANVGAVAWRSGALQIVAPPARSDGDSENQDADHVYEQMLANAMASSIGGAGNGDDALDDSVLATLCNNELATIEEGDEAADAKDRPLCSQDSLDQNHPSSTYDCENIKAYVLKEESILSESTWSRKQSKCSSKGVADLDALIDSADSRASSVSESEVVYDDIEEAMMLAHASNVADAVGSGSNECVGGEDANEDNSQRIDFVRDDLVDRSPSNSDGFALPHGILKNINEAAERKRSGESSQNDGSREAEEVKAEEMIEFESFSNFASVSPTEEYPIGNAAASKKPDNEKRSAHNILHAIGEAARSTASSKSLIKDSYIPREEIPSTRSDVVSPSSSVSAARDCGSPPPLSLDPPGDLPVDPPGDPPIDPPGNAGDAVAGILAEWTVKADAAPGTMAEVDDNGLSGADRAGCAIALIEQARESLPIRSLAWKQGSADAAIMAPSSEATANKWNLLSSKTPKSSLDPDVAVLVSDDEDDGAVVSRPWKDKWDNDPFTGDACAGMRMVSPIMSSVMTDNTDSSNFDPDSDWEVDDTSVDFGLTEEPFVPSPPSKGPQRIW